MKQKCARHFWQDYEPPAVEPDSEGSESDMSSVATDLEYFDDDDDEETQTSLTSDVKQAFTSLCEFVRNPRKFLWPTAADKLDDIYKLDDHARARLIAQLLAEEAEEEEEEKEERRASLLSMLLQFLCLVVFVAVVIRYADVDEHQRTMWQYRYRSWE